MDRLKTLYGKLTTRQKNVYKGYLDLFHRGDHEDKQQTYLRMIDKDPDITYADAANRLYGDPRSKAFLMLRARLYERLTEYLSSSLNSGHAKYDKEMPYSHDLMQYRKHMLAAQVLFSMGASELGVDHLKHARGLASDCCTTELETDVLLRLRGNFRTNDANYQEIDEALHIAQRASITDVEAIGIYHRYLHQYLNRSGLAAEKLSYLQGHLPAIEKRLKKDHSVRGEYYFHLLGIQKALLTDDYEFGCESALSAVALLDKHTGLRTRQRRSEPYAQLGNLGLRFGHFSEAIRYLEKAREFTKPESMPLFSVTTGLLYALIYNGDFDRAREEMEILEKLKAFPQFQEKYSIMGMHIYLDACISFLEGKAGEAWRKLQPITQLYADKVGWGMGLRIFEVITLVEMGEYEWAESRVESMRKHKEKHEVSERDQAIYALLKHASRHFFEGEPIEEARKKLEIMETKEWIPLGHEVIRVDEWYRKRIAQRGK